MQYIFLDESGSLGKAQKENDIFLIGAVFVDSLDSVYEIQNNIQEFRSSSGLPNDFEFHFYENSNRQKRLFLKFLSQLDFKYKVFVFEKNGELDYGHVAAALDDDFGKIEDSLNIKMDSNPHLHKELSKCLRKHKKKAKIKEMRSGSSDLIQVADYAAGVERKKLISNHNDRYDGYIELKKLP